MRLPASALAAVAHLTPPACEEFSASRLHCSIKSTGKVFLKTFRSHFQSSAFRDQFQAETDNPPPRGVYGRQSRPFSAGEAPEDSRFPCICFQFFCFFGSGTSLPTAAQKLSRTQSPKGGSSNLVLSAEGVSEGRSYWSTGCSRP